MVDFENDELMNFCQQIFTSYGSLVEVSNNGSMEVVVSDELSANFTNNSYLKFVFDHNLLTQYPEAEFISYGHPTLDILINLASQKGFLTRWYINGLKTTIGYLSEKIAHKVKFYNCKVKYILDILERFSYCLFNFKISYLSDDKKEEIKTVLVDRFSAGVNTKLLNVLNTLSLGSRCEFRGMSEGEIRPLEEVYQSACTWIKNNISASIEEMKKGILKRLSKEIRRVENYYLENETEIQQKLSKAGLSNEKRQKIKQKLKINAIEKEKKILDLEEKYKLKVNIKLLNLALIYQPKIKCKLEIIGKGSNRFYFNVFWNPVFREIEEPYCMKCKSPSYNMWFNADFGLICPTCNSLSAQQ